MAVAATDMSLAHDSLADDGKPVTPLLREMLGIEKPSRNGVQLREAKREKANQDLLYRSEYLAGLVTEVAKVQATPVQKVMQTLASSPVPNMIAASANLHHTGQSTRSKRIVDQSGASDRPRTAPTLWDLDTDSLTRGRASFARGPATTSRAQTARTGEDPLARYLNAWEGYQEVTGDVLLHTGTMLREPLLTQHGDRKMSESTRIPNPLDALKIQPVPGIPRGSLYGDHAEAAEMEVARHANRCRHVARLKEEDMGDSSARTLRFAKYYWSNRTKEELIAAEGYQEALSQRFHRVDGHDDCTGTHKFSLMELGTLLMREEGRDPFHSHALVTMERPVQVFPDGHYFEVQVVSLFRTAGRPDRPRHLETRQRTEGLVIGMTETNPSEFGSQVRSATDVPRAWCIATSGKFYAADAPKEVKKMSVNQERITKSPIWHQRVGKSEQLKCCWPPAPHAAGTVRRKLDWSVALGEGERLGMLITPFGGIVVLVNGERQLFLPDAEVRMGVDLYPLVEAYNHVRSVRVLPGARPPR